MSTRQYNLLVVDDEEIVLTLVQDALENKPLKIHLAAGADEALNILKKVPIDILLTDIRMPGMNGIELAEQARLLRNDIQVIFMTGYANLGSAKNAIQQGAVDYILKPFELNEIREAIENAMSEIDEDTTVVSHRELSRLSGLGQMLFTAGDPKSLVSSSLQFAMLHQNCRSGCMLYRTSRDDTVRLLTIERHSSSESHLTERISEIIDSIPLEPKLEPALVSSLSEHAAMMKLARPACVSLLPEWVRNETPLILIPVSRPEFLFGVMILNCEDDQSTFLPTEREILSIVANQLSSMLENTNLLNETQRAYARLRELQDETIELEKMATRGAMSAEIGHELNNFLSIVQGNVTLLGLSIEKENYDQIGRIVEKITSTVERMTKFTSNLMDLRSISSEKEQVCFNQLLTEVVEYLSPQKRFRGVTITVPEELEELPILADSTQMRQVLYNLFNNAADSMMKAPIRQIDVSLSTDTSSNEFTLSIHDTGDGFEPQMLEKAFKEQFTTKEDGHGFGLVVCGRIIEQHDGRIHIESRPNEGTRISVTLPLAQAKPVSSSV